jgi:dCMP deaminase
MTNRPSKDQYYMKIAQAISGRGTCIRRLVGAIIVKNDRIISAGYVGAPRGEVNCIDADFCHRKDMNVPVGHFYELCRSVHAEENAIINAASSGANIEGGVLYVFSAPRSKDAYPQNQDSTALYFPCYRCKKMIVNSGLKEIVILYGENIQRFSVKEIRKMLKRDEIQQKDNFIKFAQNIKNGD